MGAGYSGLEKIAHLKPRYLKFDRELIRDIPDPTQRRQAAKVFLELFRLLHYLEFTDPDRLDEDVLRDTLLPFALITSETRLLLSYIERRVLKGRSPFAADREHFHHVLLLAGYAGGLELLRSLGSPLPRRRLSLMKRWRRRGKRR